MSAIDPTKKFQYKSSAGGLESCKVLSVGGTGVAATANLSIVAGVASKVVRVMGWRVSPITNVAGGYFILKDGSGGRSIAAHGEILGTQALGFPNVAPIIDSGYDETSTGNGLFMDTGPQGCAYMIYYITYTL